MSFSAGLSVWKGRAADLVFSYVSLPVSNNSEMMFEIAFDRVTVMASSSDFHGESGGKKIKKIKKCCQVDLSSKRASDHQRLAASWAWLFHGFHDNNMFS